MRVVASGKFTYSDHYSACVAMIRTRALIAFAAVGFVLFAAGMTGLLVGTGFGNPVVILFPILLGGAWSTLPWSQPYVAAKRMHKGPSFQGSVEYEFKDRGIRSNFPTAITEWQWSSFIKWKNAPSTLLLYTAPNCALLVPKRFIPSEADLNQIESLLRQNIGEPVR